MALCKAVIGLASVTLAAAQFDTPGFQFLGNGYDILRGNPLASSGAGDMGYTRPIFEYTREEQRMTEDGRWNVPDKTTSQDIYACSLTQNQKTINSAYEYQKTIKNGVDVGGSYMGVEFSFAPDFKHIRENTRNNKKIYTHLTSMCATYELTMHLFDAPKVSLDFQRAVARLATDYEQVQYMQFLQYFGTHVIHQMRLGGRWGWQMEFEGSDYQNLLDDGVDISVGVKYAGEVVAGIGFNHSHDKRTMKQVCKAITKNSTFNVGGTYSPDVQEWMESVKAGPMPLHIRLLPMEDIFSRTFLPDTADLEAKRANVQMAVRNYCHWNAERHDVESGHCTPPKPKPMPKPTPPKPDAIRRICVKNHAWFWLSWQLIDVASNGREVKAETENYRAGRTECIEGSKVSATRGDSIYCNVHASGGGHRDCQGPNMTWDDRSNLQANYKCKGTTGIFSCKFQDYSKIPDSEEVLEVMV